MDLSACYDTESGGAALLEVAFGDEFDGDSTPCSPFGVVLSEPGSGVARRCRALLTLQILKIGISLP